MFRLWKRPARAVWPTAVAVNGIVDANRNRSARLCILSALRIRPAAARRTGKQKSAWSCSPGVRLALTVTSAVSAQEAVDQDKAVAEADQQQAAAEAENADAAEAGASERERTQSTDAEELAAIERNAQSATSKPESPEAKQVCRRIEVTGTHFTQARVQRRLEQWAATGLRAIRTGAALRARRSKPVDGHPGPRAWAGYRARPSFRASEPGRPLIRRGQTTARQILAARSRCAHCNRLELVVTRRSWSDRCPENAGPRACGSEDSAGSHRRRCSERY